jgi:lipid A 3-O-deacylase
LILHVFGPALAVTLLACRPGLSDGIQYEHDIDYVSFQAGVWSFVSGGSDDNKTAAGMGLEYRAGVHLWWLHPFAGLVGTSRGSIYGYGGVLADVPLTKRVFLSPSVAIGGYRRGSGRKMGSVFEFRLGVEVSFRLKYETRLGVRFEHMSNAGIGPPNPGIGSVFVAYSVPLDRLFSR